ncbi:MAG: aminoacyl-histidine dipeptidase [Lachnospiraceae bacterium]|nr:aminoacyl-histidine dipeptidase [Lachnospiraceae bacterium]
MSVLSELKPYNVFKYFEEICSVPHGSGNTKQISDLCASFAEKMGLKYVQDELNNLVIYKPASKGMEDKETIILQGHMDMVCAKTAECMKDMASEGLDIYIDGDHVRAKDTSLGGDDGIAVAIILAILEDDELVHPAIEAVFTVDEEVGMNGARGLDMSLLKGRRMLNLDSEEEGVFTVSCAGGLRMDCEIPCEYENTDEKTMSYNIIIDGLIGGHSGCEIDKGRGNAIKLMSRFLYRASKEIDNLRIADIKGGEFDNVICNRCMARIYVPYQNASALEKLVSEFDGIYKDEFKVTDPEVSIKAVKNDILTNNSINKAFNTVDSNKIIDSLFLVPQGIAAMSPDINGLVQTSSNIGVVNTYENGLKFTVSVRSSVSSQKHALRDRIEAAVIGFGGNVTIRGEYPGWAYRKDSPVRDTLSRIYEKKTGKKPVITAIHAGLECGLFSEALNGLDCVSIGPELTDIHSVGEKLGIASVGRLYEMVVEFLRTYSS